MGRFYPLYIRRSDGVLEVTARHGKREKNEPTPEQLDPSPDSKGVSDYYRLMSVNDAKYIDWRKKLGGMLIRELGGKEHLGADKAYLLYQLPENYRLYEHIKTKVQIKDAGPEDALKSAKNHAGGNNERQDAYLYGHPLGRKKRYRSPADFFPHLLWLATDQEGDSDNCSCKVCAPDELQPEDDRSKADPMKREDESRPNTQAQAVIEVTNRPPPDALRGMQQQSQMPTLEGQGTPATSLAAPLSQVRALDQQVDTQYNRFIYRPGELVWYCKGAAWGLSIIARRFSIRPSPTEPALKGYLVQPLSIPSHPERQVSLFREDHMRPWLAWSPPGFTMEGLARMPNASFEAVDWQGAMSGKYGNGDPQVDGSILAARAVDALYSLFDVLRAGDVDHAQERHWNGIFIGAEKFWIGDPARLRSGSGRDVFVITDIIERIQSIPNAQTTSSALLEGDVYQLIEAAAGTPTPSEPVLPSRMREDIARRNAITLPTKRIQCFWKLVNRRARIGLETIKGRWYEATLLMPILVNGEEEYAASVAKGDVHEVGAMMNARGDAQSGPFKRTQTRREAFGAAVPSDMAIVDGIEPPPGDELTKMFNRANADANQGQQAEVPIDDLMDFGDAGADQGKSGGFY